VTEPHAFGPVLIQVPPEPSLSRVLRLAASGIASLAGFTIDETEDIKLAVSEVFLALLEHGSGHVVDMRFTVDEQLFIVRGQTVVTSFNAEHPDLVVSRTVLAEVSSNSGFELVEDSAHIWAEVAHATIE
jgi:hypothetical protein